LIFYIDIDIAIIGGLSNQNKRAVAAFHHLENDTARVVASIQTLRQTFKQHIKVKS
jgi:hypothetical protein